MNEQEREKALEAAYERLGTRTPRCSMSCEETDPDALTGTLPEIICYEHLAEAAGHKPTEGDHLAGQHNMPTPVIDLPGNDHRIKSARMSFWPEKTLHNPEQSPLLRAAATIRGWVDVLWAIIHHGLAWVPPFLEWLDEALIGWIGPGWWNTLGWGFA